MSLLDGERGADQGFAALDAHEHQPVAQPLLDVDAEDRGDLADRGPQDLELGDGSVVAVLVDEVGEAAQVDEGERAMDSVIGGDGGQLGGVHGGSWRSGTSIGRRRDPNARGL